MYKYTYIIAHTHTHTHTHTQVVVLLSYNSVASVPVDFIVRVIAAGITSLTTLKASYTGSLRPHLIHWYLKASYTSNLPVSQASNSEGLI
jgi:hypothetical protein